jgi:hypothetical protein
MWADFGIIIASSVLHWEDSVYLKSGLIDHVCEVSISACSVIDLKDNEFISHMCNILIVISYHIA